MVSLRNGKRCWASAERPMCAAGWAYLEASPCQLQPEEWGEAVTVVSEVHRRWPPRPGQRRHGEGGAFSRRRREERGGQALALLTGAWLGEAAGLRHVTLPGLQSRESDLQWGSGRRRGCRGDLRSQRRHGWKCLAQHPVVEGSRALRPWSSPSIPGCHFIILDFALQEGAFLPNRCVPSSPQTQLASGAGVVTDGK